jgi:hypothetical protein
LVKERFVKRWGSIVGVLALVVVVSAQAPGFRDGVGFRVSGAGWYLSGSGAPASSALATAAPKGSVWGRTDTGDLCRKTGAAGSTTWSCVASISAGGDASTNTSTSVVSEIALFADTTGKLLKRATGTGFAKVTSGVLSAVSSIVEADLALTDVTTANASTSAHGFLKKLDNNAAHYMDGTGAWSTPGGSGSGVVVQVVTTQTGAASTDATGIPFDDTIPQNTEGTEFMTLSITPTSASNRLRIDVVLFGSATTTPWVTVALFQDSTANALSATSSFVAVSTSGYSIPLTYFMTAGTTSSTTFKVRAGSSTGTMTFNGQSGARRLGGVMASSITITEITP